MHVDCVGWYGEGGLYLITIHGDNLAALIGVKGTGAGVKRFTIRAAHLKPARAIDGNVQLVACIGQWPLQMNVADRGKPRAQPQLCTFRNSTGSAGIRDAVGAFNLIQKIRELGARALEARRIDIRNIVGNDFNIGLLGCHAGCCDREGAHVLFLQICILLISRNALTILSRMASAACNDCSACIVAMTACCAEALPSMAAIAVDSPFRSASMAPVPRLLSRPSNPSPLEAAPCSGALCVGSNAPALLIADVINCHLAASQWSWTSFRVPA